MRLIRESLKIDPKVGFRVDAPPRFAPPDGMIANLGFGPGLSAAAFADAASAIVVALSSTSFKKLFVEFARRDNCSSGTVSLFFSKKPSVS